MHGWMMNRCLWGLDGWMDRAYLEGLVARDQVTSPETEHLEERRC